MKITLISMVFYIAGVGLIIKVFSVYYFYVFTLKKWSKTEGKIIESGVEYFRSKTDSDTEGWKSKTVYMYNVGDNTYTNDEVTKNIGILLPSKSSAKKNIKYVVGQKIVVYYNKKNPKESIIDGFFDNSNLLYVLMAIIAFVVANW